MNLNFKIPKELTSKNLLVLVISLLLGFAIYIKSCNWALEGDVGCFSAIGQEILNGKILYKEVFDNKAPGIFFLHAFFQWITFKSMHYQAIMHCSILACTTFIFLFWITRSLNILETFCISVGYSLLLYYITLQWVFFQYGGFTEEIGMLFLIASISLLFLTWDSINTSNLIISFIAGFFLVCAVLIKEPFVFSYLAFITGFIIQGFKQNFKKVFFFHLGIFGGGGIFFCYLIWNHAFSDYLFYLKFATNYANKTQNSIVFIDEIKNIIFGIYCEFKYLFWVLVIYAIINFRQFQNQINLKVCFVLVVLIVCSISFVKMGQITYLHYYIPFILTCFIFFIYVFSIFVNVGFDSIGNKIKFIILSGLFIYTMNQFYLKCIKKIKIDGLSIESELTAINFKKLYNSNCYIDEQGSGRFYYYLNCYSGLKYPCPYYVYFLENNDLNSDNSQVHRVQKDFYDDFTKNPPKYMITKKELSPAFYYGALNEKVGLHYRTIDSFTLNEIKFYIRQKRKSAF